MAALPFQVGITGGIGSGKTTVANIFAALGVPVYDADSRAREIMNTDEVLIDQIKNEFGKEAYDSSGKLDRKFLADKVFGSPDQLRKLNGFVHPRVGLDYTKWVSVQSKPYVLKEAALLFESGSAKQLDKIILVTAPESLRVTRVTNRDKRSESEIKNIIQRQWPEEKSRLHADYVITNDGASAVIPQVLKIHREILVLTGMAKTV
jgi:dephospho-CoA kinase